MRPDDIFFVLPEAQARSMLAPDADAYWTPLQEDLREIIRTLPSYIAKNRQGFDIIPSLADYKAQFVGVVRNRKRSILANYVCKRAFDEHISEDEWHHHWIFVYDGGGCFFHFSYDPVKKSIHDLVVNASL